MVTDPLRVGHEERYYPGDVNFRAADIVVINKANTASHPAIEQVCCCVWVWVLCLCGYPVCIFFRCVALVSCVNVLGQVSTENILH